MSGLYTNGIPTITTFTGKEQFPVDTQNTQGVSPETAALTLTQAAVMALFLTSNLAAGKTMVAGTRYYSSFHIGVPALLTGISILLGATGGTDKWTAELFNSDGVLVATSDFATGITAGTAATWQQLPFGVTASEAAVQVAAGDYFISLQSNGTTAKFAAYNAPTAPGGLVTGSQAGTFTTQAPISTPSTTYTANLGPIALVY